MLVSHVLLFVSILTFILGVPVNILAFHTLYIKLRNEPKPMDMLLLNLSVADLMFLIILPVKMKEAADNMEWNLPYFLCPLSTIIFYSSFYTITLLMTAVAVERYLAVTFPVQYMVRRRPRYAMMASIFFWLVSSINIGIVHYRSSMHADNGTSTVASEVQKPTNCCDYQYDQRTFVQIVRFELFLVLFLIPFLICCFCYINFIRNIFLRSTVSRKHRRRGVGLTSLTLLMFVVCFAPFNISHVVNYVHGRSEGWRVPALICATLTVCLDLMMFYFSPAMREVVSHYLQVLKEKLCIRCCFQAQHCPPMFSAGTELELSSSNPAKAKDFKEKSGENQI